jgi:hypothetical protein
MSYAKALKATLPIPWNSLKRVRCISNARHVRVARLENQASLKQLKQVDLLYADILRYW